MDSVLGSLRRAVIAIGVLAVIMALSGGIVVLASMVSAGRMCSGSLVEVRRSRREKKLERRQIGANRTGSMRPSPPWDMGRQLCIQERGVSVVRRHFWSDEAKRLAHWVGKSNRRGGGRARSRWTILGVERECRRRVRAACGWLRLGSVFRSGESFLRVELRKELTDCAEPNGSPSSVVPFSHGEKGMCTRWSGREGGVVGDDRTHFSALTFRSVGWSWFRR